VLFKRIEVRAKADAFVPLHGYLTQFLNSLGLLRSLLLLLKTPYSSSQDTARLPWLADLRASTSTLLPCQAFDPDGLLHAQSPS